MRFVPACVLAVLVSVPAYAQPSAAPSLPLRANFSLQETAVAITVAAAGAFVLAKGNLFFDPPAPGMGAPHPDSLDARISRAMYQRSGNRLWWGVPDVTGAVLLPVVPALVYGLDWFALHSRGRPVVARGDANPHHRLVAFIEALGWTYLVTGLVKYTAGRPRPYTDVANDHPSLRRRQSEDNLAFFSGHASVSFAVGAFLTEDVSRYLLRVNLAGSGPVPRLLLGRVLPHLLGYGIPVLVGISRVVDQQHWPSDVLAGAVTGALISHLVYAVHFDSAGNPQNRHHRTGRLVPLAGRDRDGTRRLLVAYQLTY